MGPKSIKKARKQWDQKASKKLGNNGTIQAAYFQPTEKPQRN
jgi:hypothetical protein